MDGAGRLGAALAQLVRTGQAADSVGMGVGLQPAAATALDPFARRSARQSIEALPGWLMRAAASVNMQITKQFPVLVGMARGCSREMPLLS